MPKFRCEFKVTCDLDLDDKVDSLSIKGNDGNTYEFTNESKNKEGHVPSLIVTVYGESVSIDEAQEYLRSCLAKQLDVFTFATHSRCEIVEPIRLVEWDEGKKERHFRVFHTSDARFPPEPKRLHDFLITTSILDNADPPSYVRTALRYFRFGVLDFQPEDQYMRFWLALEVIAENMKVNDPVSIICQECKEAMTCNVCGAQPTRIPMAKQAIEAISEKVIGENWRNVLKPLFITRNGIMHGSSVDSLEKKSKQSISKSVNQIARLVWNAIRINIKLNEEEQSQLVLGHRNGEFANLQLMASIDGSFE